MYIAKKKFGQNFLKDKNALNKIIESIPENAENIVEIGAGLGDLTYELLRKFKVKSYEIDKDLIEFLKSKFACELENGKFELVFGDALKFWKNGLCNKNYFLVANLPYYVATNMILKAIDDELCDGFVAMMQKEVAEKFCAESGDSEFGGISVLADIFGKCEFLFSVPADSFEPAPKVVSAVIRLKKTRKIDDIFENSVQYENFKNFLKICFSSPRKTIMKNLSTKFDKEILQSIFEKLDLTTNLRAHELNFTLFFKIFKNLRIRDERNK